MTVASTRVASPAKALPATLTVHVYTDADASGIQDNNDTNLAGVVVSLLNADGTATGKTAVTDAAGNVAFSGLTPGSYQVSVAPPAGSVVTQRAKIQKPIVLTGGGTAAATEGVYMPVTFTTHVYTDATANGVQDGSDTNLAGLRVRLLNGDGTATGKTGLTDARGNAIFSGLKPGSYEVSVAAPASGGVTQQTNLLTPITLASGGTASAIEGVYSPARFTAHVYTDANANGVQDSADKNLAGVLVNLLNADGSSTGKTATTDGGGNVTFSGLKPGSYEVSIAAPAGDVASQQTNLLTPIGLTSGGTANAVEGVYAAATFTAHVYTDATANNVQDGADKSSAGIMVTLLNADGTKTGKTALTNAGGNAVFSGLKPGSYQVSIAAPAGDIATQQSNVMTPIRLVSGATANAIEGLYAAAIFSAHVYTDANGNGVEDSGDSGLGGVTVNLLNGIGTATGVSAITNSSGNATFSGLRPGSYEVSAATPAGDTATQQTGLLTPVTLASGGTANAVAGIYVPASITMHAYTDANHNGTQDAGEANLAGVTINLLNGDGTATGVSAVTGASGDAGFSGLKPGSYEVAVAAPAGKITTQHTNVATPISLVSGMKVNAVEGLAVPPPVAAVMIASSAATPVAGADAAVGLVAVGAPVYAADARVLTVGAGKQYQTIASAIGASRDGDVILVDSGTYTNDFAVVNAKISLIAVGGRVTMNATVPPPNFKGILTQETDLTVVGFDFTNCRIPDEDGHNGAGIRVDSGNLTLLNDSFVGNQDGLLTNAGTESIVIDHCLFNDNGGADGNGAGNIHNVYIGDVASATVTNSVFENAQVGHEFKSRAEANTLINDLFISGVGIGSGSYDIDLPNGGKDILKNNTIVKGPNAENYNMVHFGGEGIPYAGSSLVLQGNLFQTTNSSAVGLINQTAITAVLTGNVLDGLDPSRFIQGPAKTSNNFDASGTQLQDATLVGVLPGSTMIITDADPHSVVLQSGPIQAVEGGAGLLTLDVQIGHIIVIGGSGGVTVTETPGVTGGNQYTTAAGSTNTLNLLGLGMNSIDSEGTDTIVSGDGNETGVINGTATITGGAGTGQWSVNGSASIYTGTGSEFMTLGSAGTLAITGTNDFFELGTNGGTATWDTVNAGIAVTGSVAGGAVSMQVYLGRANITTSGGSTGVVLHLDKGDASVRSLGADTIYAGAGYSNIIVSGAAKVYAGTGKLEIYGRSDTVGADVYGGGGDYIIGGDTGNITYHGGDQANTAEVNLANITLIGGAGLMTINGGSRNSVVGGAGGIIYHDFGGGANTVTTMAASTNLLEISGSDVINSYGRDTINHSGGNNTINIYGDSSLWMGDGNSHVFLAGKDTVTVAPTSGGNNWFTVAHGANVSFKVDNVNWIHDAGATATVAVASSDAPDIARSVVTVSGGVADLSTDPVAGVGVTTEGSSPVNITADGPVSIKSNGADTIHLGAGAASVVTSANGARIWSGTGAATITSGDWTSADVTTVTGGSGSVSVTGCAGMMKFIGGSGSSVVLGTYGSLDVTGGSGGIAVGWSGPYGGPTSFTAGSGSATVQIGSQGGRVQFGIGDTTISGSDWAHATTYSFLAGQSGTDIISNFVAGWDKTELGAGVSVTSQDMVGGSAHFVLSSGANVTFRGISDTHGLFG